MLAALLRRDLRLRCGLHRQPPLSLCCSHAIPRISVSSRSLRSKATQPTRAMSSMFTWRNRTKTPPLVVEDRISLKLRTSVIVQVEVRTPATLMRERDWR